MRNETATGVKSISNKWWLLAGTLVVLALIGAFAPDAPAENESPKVVERIVQVPVEVPVYRTVQRTPAMMTTELRVAEPEPPKLANNTNNGYQNDTFNFNVSGTGNSVVIVTGEPKPEPTIQRDTRMGGVAKLVTASKRQTVRPAHCIEGRRQYEATVAKWNQYFE